MGAIVESSRENSLTKHILDDLLKNCIIKYFFTHFSFDEARILFEENLLNCHYCNPEKKI